jgi:hypothetical protein
MNYTKCLICDGPVKGFDSIRGVCYTCINNDDEEDSDHILWLRKAGCKCDPPLLGYRPGVGPRCRICNTIAAQLFWMRPDTDEELKIAWELEQKHNKIAEEQRLEHRRELYQTLRKEFEG